MVFDFLCDQKRKVKSSEPANGACANCGESASNVEVVETYRCCVIPLFRKSHREIMCNTCEWRVEA